MNILVTGSRSGLGRFLHEELGGFSLSREMPLAHLELPGCLDAIIHCAFNSNNSTSSKDLYSYLDDNIFLTSRLTEIPCRKFVYLSSIDVYPKDDAEHTEDEHIDLSRLSVSYSIMKLLAESIIQKKCENYVIIRPGLLLGKYTRKNNLVKLISNDNVSLSLTKESTFNCVLYSDLLCFFKEVMKQDLSGIFNAVRSNCLSLGGVARNLKKAVSFGDYTYKSGTISNRKISEICRCFSGKSEGAINEFIKELEQ